MNRSASPLGPNPAAASPPGPQQPTTNDQAARRRQRSGSGTASSSLEQAFSLRDQLRVALTSSKELIRSLKTEQRSQTSLKSGLASLKQLQTVA